MEYLNGRRVVISALTGSHNYGLNTVTSDKDYKYFVMPTFEDLYHGTFFSSSHNSPELDYTVHDVRKLPELLYKSNINFMEVLFSVDQHHDPIVNFLFYDRERTARMNLPYLWNACMGMHIQKRNGLRKGESEQVKTSIAKYGYDVKQAMHSYRALDFLLRYAKYGRFDLAMNYKKIDFGADTLWELRNGELRVEQVDLLLRQFGDRMDISDEKMFYKDAPVDEVWYKALQYDMEKAVKEEVRRELQKDAIQI